MAGRLGLLGKPPHERLVTPLDLLLTYARTTPGYGGSGITTKKKPSPPPAIPAPHFAVRESDSGSIDPWQHLFCGLRNYYRPQVHGACFDAVHYKKGLFLTICHNDNDVPNYLRAYEDKGTGTLWEMKDRAATEKIGQIWEGCETRGRAVRPASPAQRRKAIYKAAVALTRVLSKGTQSKTRGPKEKAIEVTKKGTIKLPLALSPRLTAKDLPPDLPI